MDFQKIKTELKDYDEVRITGFCVYLKELLTAKDKQGVLKNKWMQYVKENELIYFFKKVAATGLWLDGDMVTLQYKGKLMVSFDYQAYKNLVLMRYRDTIFDMQIVRKPDIFSFKKESGKVIYSHEMVSPFEETEIIGAYCIIKNRKGEFIETMSREEIEKCRKVAKTDYIWKTWYSRMCLKSVIKRSCSAHFKDVVVNVEKMDNENYDLEKPNNDRPDVPLDMFKKLVKDLPDSNQLIEQFEPISLKDRRKYYQQTEERIENENT